MLVPLPTDRLAFREMSEADLGFVAGLLGDPAVMTFYPRPKSRHEARAWIAWNQRLYHERGYGLWLLSLRATGELVGECGITPQVVDGVEEIELGYHVQRRFQGLGLATEAALAVRDHAHAALGVARLIAIIDPRNEPSQRVASKAGLAFERVVERAGTRARIYATSKEET